MTITSAARAAIDLPADAVYIGGEWIVPDDEPRLDVINPATEERIGSVTDCSAETAAKATAAARRAFDDWSRTSAGQRAAHLDALADAFEQHGDQLAALAAREIGMPLREARAVQVDLPTRVLRSTADLARAYRWDGRDASGSSIVREPSGVVLAITPWNFPVHQIVAKLAPALAAGCTVVVKPAELTPLNALFVAALCGEAGIPAGVVNIVTGRGATTGEALVQSGDYDVVSFTGSLTIGRHIGAVAGGRIVRATLELGGKSPAVLLDDADLDTAVRTTVKNCFVNAGQKCNAPTRLIVPEELRAVAVNIAAAAADAYVLGDPLDEATTMGPLASHAQRDKVLGYLDGARRDGRVVTGGLADEHERGYFVRPAIVTDLPETAPVVREEIFGPVLVVLGHRGEDDAVRIANDTEYGLSAEVWSGDPARAAALARRVRAGQVRVNGVRTPSLPVSPFGGYKMSGLGREMGAFALEEYLEVKAILGDPELT
ncbi:aldehyde dehydrogenase family protein [Amycolatopsis acidiphila]|uniref:aldehyde dehydrogenase (NAD(+)) n=1 Tax=Amycolatopsis acidiphila TaxID=715473 RepID=A0A558A119_9PSEU|nr:aldehyde dehydrogenase family protein [Amycolatopsis acidiphila]TVT17944.1 aldehyde dehydrogenase family protein [Amycolatopsis acidiphila]UIJ57847.1 aldehyde dehydrogenase family protein [Amycolatopsis acidiphila]GHG71430.1 aldehyde dehydrogenase [Amycolatopsis acidiphila]